MPRRAPCLAALALCLGFGACARSSESPIADEPNPASRDKREPATARGGSPAAWTPAGVRTPAAPVAVVAGTDSEADPCEQTCGELGDCLRADPDQVEAASHLELACLELCVHVDPEVQAGADFRACGDAPGCEEVLSCARERWGAAEASRGKSTAYQGPYEAPMTCELMCRAVLACSLHDVPPNQLNDANIEFGPELQNCSEGCDQRADAMLDPSCLQTNSCQQLFECLMASR